MRPLSGRASSDSSLSVSGKSGLVDTTVGWDAQVENFQDVDDLDIRYKIIEAANRKIKLADVIKQYNIRFTETYSSTGWDYKSTCPFPSHKGGNERSASFYINPSAGWFTCFGCDLKGNGAEFIAFIRGKDVLDVAREILTQYGSLETAIEDAHDAIDENIDETFYEFAQYIRAFIVKNKDNEKAIQYAENVLWGFDVYIAANVRKGTIFAEELEARIFKHKEALDCFGDPDE